MNQKVTLLIIASIIGSISCAPQGTPTDAVASPSESSAATPEVVPSEPEAVPSESEAAPSEPEVVPSTPEVAPSAPVVEPMPTPVAEVAPPSEPSTEAPATSTAASTSAPSTAASTAASTEGSTAPSTEAAATTEATAALSTASTTEATAAPSTEAASSSNATETTSTVAPVTEAAAPEAAPQSPASNSILDQMQGDQPVASDSTPEQEQSIDCDAKLLEMDACARRAMIMADPVIYDSPEQVQEKFCSNVTEHIRCMRDYKQCLSSFPRQVYSIVLFNIKKVSKDICESNASRSELVENLSCFREKRESIVISDISEMLTRNLDYISTLEGDTMIQNLCCGYQSMQRETKRVLDEECGCNHTTTYWTNISKSLLTDASDLLCGSYPNYDTCVEKAPSVMEFWDEKVKIVKQNGILVMNANGTTSITASPTQARASYTALTPAVKIIKKLNSQMTTNEIDNGKKGETN